MKKAICIICKKEYIKADKPNKKRVKASYIRGFKTITCSRKCSRKYRGITKKQQNKI